MARRKIPIKGGPPHVVPTRPEIERSRAFVARFREDLEARCQVLSPLEIKDLIAADCAHKRRRDVRRADGIEEALAGARELYDGDPSAPWRQKVHAPGVVDAWWNAFSEPRLYVYDETGRLLGRLVGRAIIRTTTRKRRDNKDVARAITCYFRHAAGETYAKLANGSAPIVAKRAADWLSRNIDSWLASRLRQS
ncbi:MAG: hypothetical protein NT151_11790 [Acidobacteria bacterium]|nr:hypothetical protein [Acidobacteriota bacterium]